MTYAAREIAMRLFLIKDQSEITIDHHFIRRSGDGYQVSSDNTVKNHEVEFWIWGGNLRESARRAALMFEVAR